MFLDDMLANDLHHGLVTDVSSGHRDGAPDVVTAPLAPAPVPLSSLQAGHSTGDVKAALGTQAQVITEVVLQLESSKFFLFFCSILSPLCRASLPGL